MQCSAVQLELCNTRFPRPLDALLEVRVSGWRTRHEMLISARTRKKQSGKHLTRAVGAVESDERRGNG
jgi:hypothetical protein